MSRRSIAKDDTKTKKVEFIGFDITGGEIEYDILASQVSLLCVCPAEY